MPVTLSDESRKLSPDKLSAQAYWDIVEVAYHTTQEEAFRLSDFISQTIPEFKETGGFDAVGASELDFHARKSESLSSITPEALALAVSVSEVLGCRLTYAEHNDWVRDLGYEGESVPDYGFKDFVGSLEVLGPDQIRFCKLCIQVAQPYVDRAIADDDLMNDRGKMTNLVSARNIDTRLLVLLDRVEIEEATLK